MPNVTVQQAFEFARQCQQAGRLAEAEAFCRKILAAQPEHAAAWHLLGVIAHQAGRSEVAVEWIRKAILVDPNNPVAHCHLGDIHGATGAFDDAIDAYQNALRIKPDYAEALNNMSVALAARGRPQDALAALRRAVQLKPDSAEIQMNLGNALRDQGELTEALESYHHAIRFKSDYADAYNNLGIALGALGRVDEAVAVYRHACELRPNSAPFRSNLGGAVAERGDLDEAMAEYERALQIDPHYTLALNGLGNGFRDQGRIDEAIAAYRRALELKPDQPAVQGNLIYMLHFQPGPDDRMVAEEQGRWNRRFSEPAKGLILPHTNDQDPERRLRIGYVSPGFGEHVVGRNLIPLFQQHEHGDFEVFCYSGVVKPDSLTQEFRRRADHWRSTVGVPDEALAEMIRRDGIDILVDLAQHLAGNRLTAFARQPAPVQVSFAGYPESTGVEAIGYRISDRWMEAGKGEEEWQMADGKGESVFLLDSFWCYVPCGMNAEVNALPAQESGTVTFGSLNNFCKVNEPLLRLWARVLGRVNDSQLVLLSAQGSHRQRTLDTLAREGVEARRVEFVTPRPRREYLELYHRLDMVLDPFPYNGHTTSLDALWMGVPVVSLCGKPAVSRAGLSQLSNLGLPDLVARSEDEYVRIATELAHDLSRLAELRRTLRARMEASVLMDAPRFARSIEAAYRAMWRRWCERETLAP